MKDETRKMKNKMILSPIALSFSLAMMSTYASADTSAVTAGLPAPVAAEVEVIDKHESKLEDMRRRLEILELEGQIEKASLDVEKTRSDTEKLRLGVTEEVVVPRPSSRVSANQEVLAQQPVARTPSKSSKSSAQEVEVSPLDNIYVTRIYGFGDKKEVTVYLNNSIFKLDLGETFSDGIKLVSASDTEATFSLGKKKRVVSLTTQRQAYMRTFRSMNQGSQEEDAEDDGSPNYARPLDLLR